MPAAMIQFVFRPNPGSNLGTILEYCKEAAGLWRKHGAEVHLWTVQIGEIGNMAFTVTADSTAKLGTITDAVNADPAFMQWRAQVLASGLSTWVRSNQAFEVPI